MKTNDWHLPKIIPYPGNPRINAEAVSTVAGSLQEFGAQQPIVVDADGVIIVGHTRLLAAQSLGWESFPVVVADGLTEAQVKAYRIADNRTGELAEWDAELLKIEIDGLLEMDIDLELTGFDDESLDELLGELDDEDEGLTDPDSVPEEQAMEISKTGDVWVMGSHRLVCGSSTDADVVASVLGGAKPHLMVTDPPYGVEYDANWRNEAVRKDGSKVGSRAIGKVENDDVADWTEAWALFAGDVAYVWHSTTKTNIVADSLGRTNLLIRAQIIWAKNQFVIGRGDYHQQHEVCWYVVRKGKTGHYNGDRTQSTVWEIDKPQKSETGHSTQKPVECMRKPIENNSRRGDSIYEPFSGSGTTIIAAEQTGRKCYAIEISPRYVDVAVRRWQEFTGHDAVLESTGQTFAEVEAG